MKIPSLFKSKIKKLHGAVGELWLASLPGLIKKYSQEWGLTFESTSLELSYHWVAPVRGQNNQPLMFKAGVLGKVLNQETQALRFYDGQGSVRLLEANEKDGVLLLERVEPGTPMRDCFDLDADEEAIPITARLISLLHSQEVPSSDIFKFPTLKERLNDLYRAKADIEGRRAPFDLKSVQLAIDEFERLDVSTKKSVLLHGDLHQGNILQSSDGTWVAIDPQGVIGDPCFEAAAFIRNPVSLVSSSEVAKILGRRIELFSQLLKLDRRRIWGWCFVQTLLSSWWIYEDHGEDWEAWYEMSQVLLKIKPESEEL